MTTVKDLKHGQTVRVEGRDLMVVGHKSKDATYKPFKWALMDFDDPSDRFGMGIARFLVKTDGSVWTWPFLGWLDNLGTAEYGTPAPTSYTVADLDQVG